MTLLQSLSLSGTSTTSSTFTPADYVNYFIVLSGVYVSTFFSSLEMRLNADTGSNYNRNTLQLSDTDVTCSKSTDATNIFLANINQLTGVNQKANGTILISRINDTNQVFVQASVLTTLDGAGQRLTFTNASYDNSAAISSITFLAPSYSFSGGTAYIYGVK